MVKTKRLAGDRITTHTSFSNQFSNFSNMPILVLGAAAAIISVEIVIYLVPYFSIISLLLQAYIYLSAAVVATQRWLLPKNRQNNTKIEQKKKKHKNGFVRKSTSQVNFFIYNQNVRMIAKLKHIVHGACVFVSARGDCSAPQLISRKFKFFKRRQPSLFGNESFRWWYPTIATTQHSHMNLCCYWCRCCCYFFHFHKSTDRPRRFLLLMSIICCVSVKIPSHMVDRRCETSRNPHHIWCVLLIRNFIDKSIGEN